MGLQRQIQRVQVHSIADVSLLTDHVVRLSGGGLVRRYYLELYVAGAECQGLNSGPDAFLGNSPI